MIVCVFVTKQWVDSHESSYIYMYILNYGTVALNGLLKLYNALTCIILKSNYKFVSPETMLADSN